MKKSAWQTSEDVIKEIANLIKKLDKDVSKDNTASKPLKAGSKMTIRKLSDAMSTLRSAINLHNQ